MPSYKSPSSFFKCNSFIYTIALFFYILQSFGLPLQASEYFLRDNDRVVFLGDSITEQRLYTNFIEAYALTRHPHWQLTFRNAGWAGDTAFFRSRCHPDGGRLVGVEESAQKSMIDKVIRRSFDRDVLVHKPTVVTIDFGMNDIGVRSSVDALNAYTRCLTKMVEVLQENKARTALLTPQPVEIKGLNADKEEKNCALRRFSDALKDVADKTETLYVNQFDPYMQILLRERVNYPDKFIGAGQDGVHPGAVGHTLMAWSILKGLGAKSMVSHVTVDIKAKALVNADSCTVSHLNFAEGLVAFDRLDQALPMPIHPNAEPALKLAPVLEELNQYGLQITGLEPGEYQLSIGGNVAVTKSAEEWAKGVNLAMAAGPITQQTQKLLKEVDTKNDLFFKRWRNVQLFPTPEWAQSPELEARRSAEMARLDQAIAESESKINLLRQPCQHRFELKIISR